MPLPSDVALIVVTGQYLDMAGNPLSGTVSFVPVITGAFSGAADGVILEPLTISADLDQYGAISVTLPCTDNTSIQPTGFAYTVTETITGVPERVYSVVLPSTLGSSVNLASLSPVTPPIPSSSLYGELAVANTWLGLNTFSDGIAVSPAIPIASGGTGQTTAAAAVTALTGAQHAGWYLRSNGTIAALAAIQAGDVPTLNQNTTGTAAGLSATLGLSSGGTGQTTQQAAINALTGTQAAGEYLRSNGTNAALSALNMADATGVLAVANGGTGQASALAAAAALGSPGDWFNVKASVYGAVGDGVTDDSGAINAAITACATAGGGIVYLPAGSYYVSVSVAPATGVHLLGAGMLATTILPSTTGTGATGDGIRLVCSAGSYAARVTVSDLTVDCSAQYPSYQLGSRPTPYSNGITMQGVDDLRIENVRVIKPWGYGADVTSPAGTAPFISRPQIRNLHILGERGGYDSLGGGGIIDGLVDGLYVYPAADGTNPYGTANDWTDTLRTTVKGVHAWTTFVPGAISAAATPAVPPGATNLLNPYPFPVTITLTSGSVTACTVNGVSQGTSGPWTLPGFGQISVSYSATPAWSWAAPAAPSVPASGTPATSPFPFPVGVTITGGTVSAVYVNSVLQGTTSGYFLVPLAGTISVTYSAAPSWAWASVQQAGAIMTDFGAVNARYADCYLNGFKYGIVISKPVNKQYPQEIKIDHCTIVNVGYQGIWTNIATGYGIHEIEVADCYIDKWAMTGAEPAIYMGGSVGFAVANCRFGAPGITSYCISLLTDGTNGCDYGVVTGNDLHNNSSMITTASLGSHVAIRNNPGYNPAGTLTVTVPASGSPTAAQIVDATFYVTAASSGTTTVAISGGPTITIPASACVPVRVPAGHTLTPSYSSAPTWVVEGE